MEARTQFTFYESFAKALARIKKKNDRADAYDAICNYALYGKEPDFSLVSDSVAIAFELIRPNLDASKRKAESGKRGGAVKQTVSKTEANGSKTKQTVSEDEKEKEKEGEKEREKEKEKEKEKEYECTLSISPSRETPAPATAAPTRHKHGQYGWVRLTDEEFDRLVRDYGVSKVDAAVTYVDESAQRTGNKNKWRDWNLTVRKCIREGWGQYRTQTQAPAQSVTGNPFDALRREVGI